MSNAINPYAAPVSTLNDGLSNEVLLAGAPIASQNKRFANYLLDSLAIYAMNLVVGLVLGGVVAATAISSGRELTPQEATLLNVGSFLAGTLFTLCYYAGLEAITGMTLGKLCTGTKVVNLVGQKASFGQILGRTAARMIPFEPLSFLFGDKRMGWHDTLSGTRVVDVRARRNQLGV